MYVLANVDTDTAVFICTHASAKGMQRLVRDYPHLEVRPVPTRAQGSYAHLPEVTIERWSERINTAELTAH